MKEHYKQLNRIEVKKNVQSLKEKSLNDTKKKKITRKGQQSTEKGFWRKMAKRLQSQHE